MSCHGHHYVIIHLTSQVHVVALCRFLKCQHLICRQTRLKISRLQGSTEPKSGEIIDQKRWDTMGNLCSGSWLAWMATPRFMEHNCKLYAKLFYRQGHATAPQNRRQETTDLRPAPNKTEWVNLEPRCTTKSEDGSYGGVAVGRGITPSRERSHCFKSEISRLCKAGVRRWSGDTLRKNTKWRS